MKLETLERREVLATDLDFDFGPSGQQVEVGFIGIDEYQFFDVSTGYGWSGNFGQGAGTPGAIKPEHADRVFGGGLIFRVDDLVPGRYEVLVEALDDASPVTQTVKARSGGQISTSQMDTPAGTPGSVRLELIVDENSGTTKSNLTWDPNSGTVIEGTPIFAFQNHGGLTLEFDVVSSVVVHRLGSHLPIAEIQNGILVLNPELSAASIVITTNDLTVSDGTDSLSFAEGTFTHVDAGTLPVDVSVIHSGSVTTQLREGDAGITGVHSKTITISAGSYDLDTTGVSQSIVLFLGTDGDDLYRSGFTGGSSMNGNRETGADFSIAIGIGNGNDVAEVSGTKVYAGRMTLQALNSHKTSIVVGFDTVRLGIDTDNSQQYLSQIFWLAEKKDLSYNLEYFQV